MADESYEYSQEFEALDLQNIYSQLAIPENSNFDAINEIEFANKCIEGCYDTHFLKIETEVLLDNPVRFNNEFIKLIKYAQERKFPKVHILFVAFCTYFNIDENVAFKILHEKLQKIIRAGYARMVGRDTYKRMAKRYAEHPQTNQMSLFELARKNQK